MDTTQQPPHDFEAAGEPQRKWPRRLVIGGSLVVVLGIGVGIGEAGHSTGISQATYDASQAQVSSLKGQVSVLRGQVSGLQAQVSNDNTTVAAAQSRATTAQQTANANAAASYRGKESTLSAQQQTVNQQEATLKQELGQVQGSSINGDGVYVVGQDIKAGTWHTNGSGNTGANDCYFATLNSTDTTNIADNNNFDGPETVDVSGVYAFQISGPCTWVLVP